MANPRTCVIYNPSAGRGRAKKLFDTTRAWADPNSELFPTTAPGHATELAEAAAKEGFERVIAAGGDGTVHEVANGLLRSNRPEVRFGVWPLGSSNDYAHSLGLDAWWKARGTAISLSPRFVDVGRAVAGERETYFVNCAGVGFNGMVALESRSIRWLRSIPLYALAFLRGGLWHFKAPPGTIRLDEQSSGTATLAFSVNLGRREGGFPITLGAKLDDGLFDCVHVGSIKRLELLKYLPGLIVGKLPLNHPKIRIRTASSASIRSDEPLCVHCDGEFLCKPVDGERGVKFELLPKKLLVECAPESGAFTRES